MPEISVIVPTYNRWEQLKAALTGLANQTTPQEAMEIIVISDGSTDGTNEALERGEVDLPFRFIAQENQGVAVARNRGVEAATADLVLFFDDDIVPEPECVAMHLKAHAETEQPTVVIGPQLTPEDAELEPWVAWEQAMLYKQYDAMARGDWAPTARQFYTGNASLPRKVLVESGGFNPNFKRGEDVELAYRLGGAGIPFAFEFQARAFHHAHRTYDSWLSIASSYGGNDVKLWRDHGQKWLIPTVRAEYERRNPLTRQYTQFGLRFRKLGDTISRLAPAIARTTKRLGADRVGRVTLSAVYNLAYYQGLADEIGGWQTFRAMEPKSVRELFAEETQ